MTEFDLAYVTLLHVSYAFAGKRWRMLKVETVPQIQLESDHRGPVTGLFVRAQFSATMNEIRLHRIGRLKLTGSSTVQYLPLAQSSA